jgi:hypothetical protein
VSDVRTNGQHERVVNYTPPPGPLLGEGQIGQLWGAVGAVMTGVLGLIGFVNSFLRVNEAMQPSFGGLAWSVPVGIDVGILAFTSLDLWMAKDGIRTRWLRLIPWALVAVTVYLNVSGETDRAGWVAHAALPMLWVVAVEVGAHVVRHRAGLAGKGDQMDKVRSSRWVLAPMSTMQLRRQMILDEQQSYPKAVDKDVDRRVIKALWRDEYGLYWRWRVPRVQRVLYRHGRLTPTGLSTEVPASLPGASPPELPQNAPKAPKAPKPKAITAPTEDLLTAARRIVKENGGDVPGRPTFRPLLKAAGHSIGNDDLGALIQRLRAEKKESESAG